MELPDYPWFIVKQFLLRKKHPTAKLIKFYAESYQRPQIFMTYYAKLRNGMYVKVEKPILGMEKSLSSLNISFSAFVKIKSIK